MAKSYQTKKVFINSNGHKISLLIVSPKERLSKEETPGVLWIHGGGYLFGGTYMTFFTRAISLVKKFKAVVVAVNYRKAFRYPYPAALEDSYNALLYLKENADKLGINKSQIMVGGESAGGGLTCAVAIYARDKKEVNIAYQMPLYPMIDCFDTQSNIDNHAPVWNTKSNRYAWKKYLRELLNCNEVPSYASPSRLKDYSNLPPAYTFVGDIEPFYCETLNYINNLKKAGIEASCDVYPNCFHAFDMLLPNKKESIEAIRKFEEAFLYAKNNYFKDQND